MQDVATALTAYVEELTGLRPDPGEDLFAAGLLSSLYALQLVLFVETKFGVEVCDDDLDLVNFRSVAAMEAFVAGKRGNAS